jgi:hypothetical protein
METSVANTPTVRTYSERRKRLREPNCDLIEKVDQILYDLEEIANAFPDGPLKHREAHEAWMEAKKSEKAFYDSLKTEVMKKGVAGIFAILAIILGLAVTGLGNELITHGVLKGIK